MDLGLEGKRALVTGSTSGNGEAIAKALAREGVRVVIHGSDALPDEAENLTRVLNEISAEGGDAAGHLADLGTDEGADRLAQVAEQALGCVDILINNAGVYPERTWWTATSEDWLERYSVNVISMVRLIRLLVPKMKEAGWGRVINISTGFAWQPIAQVPEYSATKAAVTNLTVSLAKELDRTGITVNTISPGTILTSGYLRYFADKAKQAGFSNNPSGIEQFVLKDVETNPVGRLGPSGRLGRPEDVGYVATILASPLAGYVNGANIRVDGGSTLTIN